MDTSTKAIFILIRSPMVRYSRTITYEKEVSLMDTQYREYFSQMMYLAGRMALLDDQTSEHWKKLEEPANPAPPVEESHISPGLLAAMLAKRRGNSPTPGKRLHSWDLRQLRTEWGLSPVELASLIGVDLSVIKYWERRDVRLPLHLSEAVRKCLVEKAAQPKGGK